MFITKLLLVVLLLYSFILWLFHTWLLYCRNVLCLIPRVEYDAYRTDLEELNLGPRDSTTLPKIEQCQQMFQIHREKYERMRNSVAIKLKLLEENKVSSLSSPHSCSNISAVKFNWLIISFVFFFLLTNRWRYCIINWVCSTMPYLHTLQGTNSNWKRHSSSSTSSWKSQVGTIHLG